MYFSIDMYVWICMYMYICIYIYMNTSISVFTIIFELSQTYTLIKKKKKFFFLYFELIHQFIYLLAYCYNSLADDLASKNKLLIS